MSNDPAPEPVGMPNLPRENSLDPEFTDEEREAYQADAGHKAYSEQVEEALGFPFPLQHEPEAKANSQEEWAKTRAKIRADLANRRHRLRVLAIQQSIVKPNPKNWYERNVLPHLVLSAKTKDFVERGVIEQSLKQGYSDAHAAQIAHTLVAVLGLYKQRLIWKAAFLPVRIIRRRRRARRA